MKLPEICTGDEEEVTSVYPVSPFQEIQINYDMIFCMKAALGN